MSHHEAEHGKATTKKGADVSKESRKPPHSAQEPARGSSPTQTATHGQTRTGTGESDSADKRRH